MPLHKMLRDNYPCLWNLTCNKLKKPEAKFKRKTGKQRYLLMESGLVPSTARPPLSRDRRIKMKKSSSNFLLKTLLDCIMFATQMLIDLEIQYGSAQPEVMHPLYKYGNS